MNNRCHWWCESIKLLLQCTWMKILGLENQSEERMHRGSALSILFCAWFFGLVPVMVHRKVAEVWNDSFSDIEWIWDIPTGQSLWYCQLCFRHNKTGNSAVVQVDMCKCQSPSFFGTYTKT
jgi:hypothetical protein